jgi:adenylosuccinate lyase
MSAFGRCAAAAARVGACLRARPVAVRRWAAAATVAVGCGAGLSLAPAQAAPHGLATLQGMAAKLEELEVTVATSKKNAAEETALLAIGPLDGRYASRLTDLQQYFSEYALIKYRVKIEVEYFIELCGAVPQLASVPSSKFEPLRDLYRNFSVADAQQIKATERITNHDVKAVEYFLKEKFDLLGLEVHKEFIHFGLTSQDVNNTAVPLMLKDAVHDVYLPKLKKFIATLHQRAVDWDHLPMLARTHGQPATPTRMGKEMMVFVERVENQIALLESIPIGCKMGGASGTIAAHVVAYPDTDWELFCNKRCARLGMQRQQYTTQIEHYDNVGALCDNMARINTILIDYCRDMWMYVSLGYFTQSVKKNEVGSSAMPHKVNPIDFENGEGNFGLANAVFGHLSAKLPISRMQRDLSDSTVIRNFGIPFGHAVVGISSTARGLSKMNVNPVALDKDLEAQWPVVSEAIQTILRREGYPKPYEALKELTRGQTHITEASIKTFVQGARGDCCTTH